MCGRFHLKASAEQIAEYFRVINIPDLFSSRYNIAPTQPVMIIKQVNGSREIAHVQWGLVPQWANDTTQSGKMINARSETAFEKPSFKGPFRYRRCLIPADGFYEWKSIGGKEKQPYHIGLKNRELFAFAGLWEIWQGDDGSELETCTILTTEANELLSDLHERMPVILPEENHEQWLDHQTQTASSLQPLLKTYPANEFKIYPVSKLVNSPKNNGPECLDEVKSQGSLF
jgi:putative SOS response-associated peptidase YedK